MGKIESYPPDTRGLMDAYLATMKDRHGMLARERVFSDFLSTEGKDLLRADPDSLRHYLGVLRERVEKGGMKPSTARKNHKILAAFLSWCAKEKEAGSRLVPDNFENAMLSVKSPYEPDSFRLEEMPSIKDIDLLVGVLAAGDREVLAAVMLAMRCFLKTGEILKLRSDEVFAEAGGKIFITPGGRSLPIIIPDDMAGLLGELVGSSRGGWLFPSKRSNSHLTGARLSARLRKACASAGIDAVTFNSLRNMAAVIAVGNGADVFRLNDGMGYRSRTHIARLTSLPLRYENVGEYVNIELKRQAGTGMEEK